MAHSVLWVEKEDKSEVLPKMIAYGENVKVFCGNSNPSFAQTVCKELGLPMGQGTVSTFADGEVSVSLEETVRGADVFLIQSTCKPVNNNLM